MNTTRTMVRLKSNNLLPLLVVVLIGCGSPNQETSVKDEKNLTNKSIDDSTDLVVDSAHCGTGTDHYLLKSENDTAYFNPVDPNDVVKNWTDEDFIISCDESMKVEVLDYISYLRVEFKPYPSPFEATYNGNDFGDYFHLAFTVNDTLYCDFGDGNNNLDEYPLYDPKTIEDNPKYLNQKFKIHWAWKASSFPCCSGAYQSVEAYIPSIVKLELVE